MFGYFCFTTDFQFEIFRVKKLCGLFIVTTSKKKDQYDRKSLFQLLVPYDSSSILSCLNKYFSPIRKIISLNFTAFFCYSFQMQPFKRNNKIKRMCKNVCWLKLRTFVKTKEQNKKNFALRKSKILVFKRDKICTKVITLDSAHSFLIQLEKRKFWFCFLLNFCQNFCFLLQKLDKNTSKITWIMYCKHITSQNIFAITFMLNT